MEEPRKREGCGGGSLQSPATWEGPSEGFGHCQVRTERGAGRRWWRSGGIVDASLVTG